MNSFFEGLLEIIAILLVAALIWGTLICLLWNWLIPAIFNGPTITWIQGYGLSLLCNCLFPKNEIKKS